MRERIEYRFPWARYPGVRLAVLLGAGIAFQVHMNPDTRLVSFLFIVIIALWAAFELVFKKFSVRSVSILTLFMYLCMIFLLGTVRQTFQAEKLNEHKNHASNVNLFEWEHIMVAGQITDRMVSTAGRVNYDLDVDITFFESVNWNQPYRIRVYGDLPGRALSKFEPGERIEAEIRIYSLQNPTNPGQFDYRAFLNRQGIFLHGELVAAEIISKRQKRLSWNLLRTAVHHRIDKTFDETTAPLAKALLTGYRQELDREERQYFARAGLSHIMAVSGMHVGFIIAPFWLLIPWLWQWRFGGVAGLIILSLLLFTYAGLTGFSASVSRASLMAWLLSAGKLMRRMKDSLNLMGVSAFILLLINPSQLFEIGFQLSFGAVMVILLLMPVTRELIPVSIRYTKRGNLLMVVLVSFIVQLGLYPLLVWYFGEFSIIGPVANALVVPLLSIVVPGSFILLPLADLNLTLLNTPNIYAFKWIAFIAEFLGSWDRSWITAEIDTSLFFLLWVFLIGFIATMKISELRAKYLILVLLVFGLMSAQKLIKKMEPSNLRITMLDVGQGDAIHMETPGGKNVLIDAGRWNPLGNSGEQVLLPYFDAKQIRKLDAVILSHPHADHIGGMPAILSEIPIDVIYYCGYDYDSDLYRNYRDKAERKEISFVQVKKGDQLPIDESMRFFVLGPDGRVHNSNPNDHSVVVQAVYHETKFLFTGDAEQHQEGRITRTYGDFLRSDFLKVGHHGSRTSSHDHFLNAISPLKAAASLAFQNRFNHPHPEAVTRLRNHTDSIYFTSLSGALVFTSDGNVVRYR
jgi:competence protein ComEC